jgi:hypothetical protein
MLRSVARGSRSNSASATPGSWNLGVVELDGAEDRVLLSLSYLEQIAASMRSASSGIPEDQRSSSAADEIAPIGLAIARPAISGADPWMGSNRPARCPRLELGSNPTAMSTACTDPLELERFHVAIRQSENER